MDLERFGRPDLAELFCEHYFGKVPCMREKADEQLFLFYKLHRANVRIKVHAIRIRELEKEEAIQAEVKRMREYMGLFREYFSHLRQQS
jgi:aminoglycoside phosphotransferase family enzyme